MKDEGLARELLSNGFPVDDPSYPNWLALPLDQPRVTSLADAVRESVADLPRLRITGSGTPVRFLASLDSWWRAHSGGAP